MQVGAFDAHEPVVAFDQTASAPAQSPQKVVSMMICCSANIWSILQAPANLAFGFLHLVGSGASPSTSAGAEPRSKRHTLMPAEFHSVAKIAPPASLRPAP